jgi:hypothetical protein
MMDRAIALTGLEINGETFLARTRVLTLTATGCEGVLKLTWPFHYKTYRNHFSWLLWRLERLKTHPQPWAWTSKRQDTRAPVHFRAWLAEPIGFRQDHPLVGTEFFLHVHLVPDDPAEDTEPRRHRKLKD